MSDPKAFAMRLEAMADDDRDHFRDVIEKLSHCYAKDAAQAVIIYSHASLPTQPHHNAKTTPLF